MPQLTLYTRCETVLLYHTQKDPKSPYQSQAPRWLGIPFSYCWHTRRKNLFLPFPNRNFSILLKLHSLASYVKSLFFTHNPHNKFNPPKFSQCNDYQLNETKRMQWIWGFFFLIVNINELKPLSCSIWPAMMDKVKISHRKNGYCQHQCKLLKKIQKFRFICEICISLTKMSHRH